MDMDHTRLTAVSLVSRSLQMPSLLRQYRVGVGTNDKLLYYISIEIYVHFRDEINMTYDVSTSEKLSYRPFDWSDNFFFTNEKLSYQPLIG